MHGQINMTKRLLITGVLTMGTLSAEDYKLPIRAPKFKLDTVGWTLTSAALGAIALDHAGSDSEKNRSGNRRAAGVEAKHREDAGDARQSTGSAGRKGHSGGRDA